MYVQLVNLDYKMTGIYVSDEKYSVSVFKHTTDRWIKRYFYYVRKI